MPGYVFLSQMDMAVNAFTWLCRTILPVRPKRSSCDTKKVLIKVLKSSYNNTQGTVLYKFMPILFEPAPPNQTRNSHTQKSEHASFYALF